MASEADRRIEYINQMIAENEAQRGFPMSQDERNNVMKLAYANPDVGGQDALSQYTQAVEPEYRAPVAQNSDDAINALSFSQPALTGAEKRAIARATSVVPAEDVKPAGTTQNAQDYMASLKIGDIDRYNELLSRKAFNPNDPAAKAVLASVMKNQASANDPVEVNDALSQYAAAKRDPNIVAYTDASGQNYQDGAIDYEQQEWVKNLKGPTPTAKASTFDAWMKR